MQKNEQIVVRLTPDGRYYTFYTERASSRPIPNTAEAVTNKTASAATIATAIQTALPKATLGN